MFYLRRVVIAAAVCFTVIAVAAAGAAEASATHDHQHHDHKKHPMKCGFKKMKHPRYHEKRVKFNPHGDMHVMKPQAQSDPFDSVRVMTYFAEGDCKTPVTEGDNVCGVCLNPDQQVTTFGDGEAEGVCTTDDVLTTAKRNFLMNTIIARAANFIQRVFKVQRVVGNFIYRAPAGESSKVCGTDGPALPPSIQASPGAPNTDLVVVVTTAPAGADTIASAAACASDATTSRPLIIHANFNAALIDPTASDAKVESQVQTAIHEIMHGLGFGADDGFGTKGYLNLDNLTYTTGTKVGMVTVTRNGKPATFINSPRVLREVRSYFNCPTLEGAEIEDGGGEGTSGGHWEKRVFDNEAMNGVDTSPIGYFSRITFALFEDLGYWKVDYNLAQSQWMTFGKNKGCPFVTEKCDSTTNRASGEYCFTEDAADDQSCLYDRLGIGRCDIDAKATGIPAWFQYFGSATKGSESEPRDYCPVTSTTVEKSCISSTNKDAQDIYGNTYSLTSRCYQSNLLTTAATVTSLGTKPKQARCFATTCLPSGAVQLTVAGATIRCPTDGSAGPATNVADLTQFQGTIICPAFAVVCPGGSLFPFGTGATNADGTPITTSAPILGTPNTPGSPNTPSTPSNTSTGIASPRSIGLLLFAAVSVLLGVSA